VFFHIFNYLHQNGKQVILTSDKAPLTCKISSNDYYLVSNGDCQQNCTNLITKQEFLSWKYLISRRCWDSRRNHRIRSTQHQIERKRTWRSHNILIAQSSFNKKEVTIELAKASLKIC
jgi:chromosomal replication initiator protein